MSQPERLASRVGAVLLAVGMVLVLAGAGLAVLEYRVYHVLSESMSPTLEPGDRIVSDTGYAGAEGIRRGDVVMLDEAAWPEEPEHSEIVKRVIALGGDTVSYSDRTKRLAVNRRPIEEDYLADGSEFAHEDFSLTVPAGQVYVLGDHRLVSIDSRPHHGKARGPVALSAVRGRVVAVVYPFGRAGSLPATGSFGPPRGADPMPLLTVGALLAGTALVLAAGTGALLGRLRRSWRAA